MPKHQRPLVVEYEICFRPTPAHPKLLLWGYAEFLSNAKMTIDFVFKVEPLCKEVQIFRITRRRVNVTKRT